MIYIIPFFTSSCYLMLSKAMETSSMAHRVLIPLDGSKVAEEAISYVMALLPPEITEIHLLTVLPELERLNHIVQFAVINQQLEEVSKITRKQQEQYTRAYLDMVAWNLEDTGYNVTTHLMYGQPADGIVRMAQALKVDLIVMTSHGRGGNLLWRYGSVAERVLEASESPVLIIPVRDALRTAQEIPEESEMAV